MKTIKKIFTLALICCIFSACAALDNSLPELTGKDKELCISAIQYFQENANNLDGEKMKIFLDTENLSNMELVFTHEEALEKYGQSMDDATKKAYWATVIVNHLMPKGTKYTDLQLKQMKIDIDQSSIRGFVDSNVFVKGTLSFKDGETPSKNIEICMHIQQDFVTKKLAPIISYIKYAD